MSNLIDQAIAKGIISFDAERKTLLTPFRAKNVTSKTLKNKYKLKRFANLYCIMAIRTNKYCNSLQ